MIRPLAFLSTPCLLFVMSMMMQADDAIRQDIVREAVAGVASSVVQIETVGGADRIDEMAVGTGPTTGLIIDAEGYLVSSSINFAHSPSGILVRLPDGQRLPARLIATDHHRKISLLKVEADAPFAVPEFVDPSQVRVGQWAIAVGRAFDADHANVAVGIISALGRVWGKALQTDAAVSPNNYGGPLINVRGEVLGLLVPMSPQSDDEVAGVEWYDSGIGFAVPADLVVQSVNRLKNGEDLHPGRIGMTLEKSVAMSDPAVVSSVLPNSPAEKAGLEKGDRIVRMDNKNITRAAEMKYALAASYADDVVSLLVRRGDRTVECEATLIAKLEPYRCPLLGILPSREKAAAPGAVVRLTLPNSPAKQAGLTPKDRVVSLDGEPISNAEDLRSRLARKKPGDKIALGVHDGTQRRDVDLSLAGSATTLPEKLPVPPIDPEAKPGREVGLTLPQWKNEVKAWLPKAYSQDRHHGLLLWLRSTTDGAASFDLWKKHADSRGLIVVHIEPSSKERWLPEEANLVREILKLSKKKFTIDPRRIVLGGQAGGGTLAYLVAAREREDLSGCALFDARLAGPRITDMPDKRFSLLIGRSDKGRLAERLDRLANLLREGGLPVIVLPRNGEPDRLTDHDAAAIARWIDLLDRI